MNELKFQLAEAQGDDTRTRLLEREGKLPEAIVFSCLGFFHSDLSD